MNVLGRRCGIFDTSALSSLRCRYGIEATVSSRSPSESVVVGALPLRHGAVGRISEPWKKSESKGRRTLVAIGSCKERGRQGPNPQPQGGGLHQSGRHPRLQWRLCRGISRRRPQQRRRRGWRKRSGEKDAHSAGRHMRAQRLPALVNVAEPQILRPLAVGR